MISWTLVRKLPDKFQCQLIALNVCGGVSPVSYTICRPACSIIWSVRFGTTTKVYIICHFLFPEPAQNIHGRCDSTTDSGRDVQVSESQNAHWAWKEFACAKTRSMSDNVEFYLGTICGWLRVWFSSGCVCLYSTKVFMTAHLHMSEMRVTPYHLRHVRNRPEGQPEEVQVD